MISKVSLVVVGIVGFCSRALLGSVESRTSSLRTRVASLPHISHARVGGLLASILRR